MNIIAIASVVMIVVGLFMAVLWSEFGEVVRWVGVGALGGGFLLLVGALTVRLFGPSGTVAGKDLIADVSQYGDAPADGDH